MITTMCQFSHVLFKIILLKEFIQAAIITSSIVAVVHIEIPQYFTIGLACGITIRVTDPALPTPSTSYSPSNDVADKGIDEHDKTTCTGRLLHRPVFWYAGGDGNYTPLVIQDGCRGVTCVDLGRIFFK